MVVKPAKLFSGRQATTTTTTTTGWQPNLFPVGGCLADRFSLLLGKKFRDFVSIPRKHSLVSSREISSTGGHDPFDQFHSKSLPTLPVTAIVSFQSG